MKADELRALAQRVVAAHERYRADREDLRAYYEITDAHAALGVANVRKSEDVARGIIAALSDAREQGRRDVLGGQLWAAGEFAIKRDSAKGKWRRLYEGHATIVAHAAREMLRAVRHG